MITQSIGQNLSPVSQALLKAVAEELKLPLIYIARKAELATLDNNLHEVTLKELQKSAISALELIDCYMLGLQLSERQQSLQLEPVSIGLVINETADKLNEVAKRYRIDLEPQLNISKKPIMANKAALKAALLSMGTAFIEAQQLTENKKNIVTIATYKTHKGVEAGLYSESCNISSSQLRAASYFFAKMRQPFGALSANSAAGIFIAQQILQAMAAQLKIAKHSNQSGIAAVLQPSRQLQLVM